VVLPGIGVVGCTTGGPGVARWLPVALPEPELPECMKRGGPVVTRRFVRGGDDLVVRGAGPEWRAAQGGAGAVRAGGGDLGRGIESPARDSGQRGGPIGERSGARVRRDRGFADSGEAAGGPPVRDPVGDDRVEVRGRFMAMLQLGQGRRAGPQPRRLMMRPA